jgi:hypothetical protein
MSSKTCSVFVRQLGGRYLGKKSELISGSLEIAHQQNFSIVKIQSPANGHLLCGRAVPRNIHEMPW